MLTTTMLTHNQQTWPAKLERLQAKAEAVHRAALNLSTTYGVFHGINSVSDKALVSTYVAEAVNSIQHDLQHLMAIRLCALCEKGPRPDDASIIVLKGEINCKRCFDPTFYDAG
jgi:hypothetical protein